MHITSNELQIASWFVGSLLTYGGIGWAIFKRHAISVLFRDKVALFNELATSKREGAAYLQRATAAETTVVDLQAGMKVLRESLSDLDARQKSLEQSWHVEKVQHSAFKEKFDAMLDYSQQLVDHAVEQERLIVQAKLDYAKSMPVVPPILADRFSLPEQQ